MYHLVQWEKCRRITVLNSASIIGQKQEGARVCVKYGDRPYYATILRSSENKRYLDTLQASQKGKVLPRKKLPLSTAVMSERAKLGTGSKTTAVAQKKVHKKRSEALLHLGREGPPDPPDSPGSPVSISASGPQDEPAIRLQGGVQGSHIGYEFPAGTAANIRYLNELAAFATAQYKNELRTTMKENLLDEGKVKRAQNELLQMSKCESAHKAELKPGSGVFAPREFLSDLGRDFKKNPKEMVRRLFKLIVGKENLKKMNACGEGEYNSVPKDVKDAVQDWVEKHTTKDLRLTSSQYNRCINLMCGTIRNPSGSDSKKAKGAYATPVSSRKRHGGRTGRKDAGCGSPTLAKATPPKQTWETELVNTPSPSSSSSKPSGMTSTGSAAAATSPWKVQMMLPTNSVQLASFSSPQPPEFNVSSTGSPAPPASVFPPPPNFSNPATPQLPPPPGHQGQFQSNMHRYAQPVATPHYYQGSYVPQWYDYGDNYGQMQESYNAQPSYGGQPHHGGETAMAPPDSPSPAMTNL